MLLNKIFIFIIVLLFSQLANAETIYKWVDEDGQAHFGSKAGSKDAQEVKIKNRYIDSGKSTPPLSAQERVDKTKKFINALDAENKSIADAKAKKKEQEELKISRCDASRNQLRRYEGSRALYNLDNKGKRVYLNKKQYEQAISQARVKVQKWCN